MIGFDYDRDLDPVVPQPLPAGVVGWSITGRTATPTQPQPTRPAPSLPSPPRGPDPDPVRGPWWPRYANLPGGAA